MNIKYRTVSYAAVIGVICTLGCYSGLAMIKRPKVQGEGLRTAAVAGEETIAPTSLKLVDLFHPGHPTFERVSSFLPNSSLANLSVDRTFRDLLKDPLRSRELLVCIHDYMNISQYTGVSDFKIKNFSRSSFNLHDYTHSNNLSANDKAEIRLLGLLPEITELLSELPQKLEEIPGVLSFIQRLFQDYQSDVENFRNSGEGYLSEDYQPSFQEIFRSRAPELIKFPEVLNHLIGALEAYANPNLEDESSGAFPPMEILSDFENKLLESGMIQELDERVVSVFLLISTHHTRDYVRGAALRELADFKVFNEQIQEHVIEKLEDPENYSPHSDSDGDGDYDGPGPGDSNFTPIAALEILGHARPLNDQVVETLLTRGINSSYSYMHQPAMEAFEELALRSLVEKESDTLKARLEGFLNHPNPEIKEAAEKVSLNLGFAKPSN